jgi:hypothetical protein
MKTSKNRDCAESPVELRENGGEAYTALPMRRVGISTQSLTIER